MSIELKKCLDDFDYEGAIPFQKAIQSKSSEILAIRRRMECNFEEIRSFERKAQSANYSIERYEKRLLDKTIDQRFVKAWTERIMYFKEELDEYNRLVTL